MSRMTVPTLTRSLLYDRHFRESSVLDLILEMRRTVEEWFLFVFCDPVNYGRGPTPVTPNSSYKRLRRGFLSRGFFFQDYNK